jgi:hypothetical protein
MIDLYAFEMEVAAVEAEAKALGMPRALVDIFEELRVKVLPNVVKYRERASD